MKRKKVIFSVLGILCVIVSVAGIIGWRLYHKSRPSLNEAPPDVTITATELYKAFSQNEQEANQKFLNKVILVSGTVTNATRDGNENSIGLSAGKDAMGEINCLLKGTPLLPKTGETLSLKGRCTGYLMDVMLVDAVIVK